MSSGETVEKFVKGTDVSTLASMLASGEISDINVRCRFDSWGDITALMFHCWQTGSSGRQVVEFHLSWSPPADVNRVSGSKMTALHFAVLYTSGIDIIKTLLDHGADRTLQDNTGTPEWYVNHHKLKEKLEVLQTYFPDVSASAIEKRKNVLALEKKECLEADKRLKEQAEAASKANAKAEADRLERERLASEIERLEADKRSKDSQFICLVLLLLRLQSLLHKAH